MIVGSDELFTLVMHHERKEGVHLGRGTVIGTFTLKDVLES